MKVLESHQYRKVIHFNFKVLNKIFHEQPLHSGNGIKIWQRVSWITLRNEKMSAIVEVSRGVGIFLEQRYILYLKHLNANNKVEQ